MHIDRPSNQQFTRTHRIEESRTAIWKWIMLS